jgi:hypothetical protein
MSFDSPGATGSAPPPPIDISDSAQSALKCKFTAEEDERLKMLVLAHGTDCWDVIAKLMGTRNHRQCRERWKNYLNPNLRTEPWSLEEDQLLVTKYAEYGPKWNKISRFFTNRSDNSIRNRWQLMLRQWERVNHHGPGKTPPEGMPSS